MWSNPVSDLCDSAPSFQCWLLYISCTENESNNLFKWFPIQVPRYECAYRIISWVVCMILSPLNWFSSFFVLIFLWCFYNSSRFCFSDLFLLQHKISFWTLYTFPVSFAFIQLPIHLFLCSSLHLSLSCPLIRFICFCASTCVFVQFFCLTTPDLLLSNEISQKSEM